MAQNKVTIDVEARFVDDLTRPAGNAEKALDDVGKSAQNAGKKVDELGKRKATPEIDAKLDKFLSNIKKAEERARKFGQTKAIIALEAMDKATSVINKIIHAAQSFHGKTYEALIKVRDSEALSSLSNLRGHAKDLAGKAWQMVVTVKDMATAPLRALHNAVFNLKTLAATIFAGVATKKLIFDPISIADATTNTLQAFRTMLGETQGEAKYNELMDLAKATPFGATDVVAQAQQLIGYGFDPSTIAETMTTIGDAAAALGKGTAGLSGLALVLGQIKARPTLSGQDVNQISGWGINARQMLADYFGVTKDEIAVMQEKGQIKGDEAVQAILAGMKNSYGGMMDKMATSTFGGLMETIKDTLSIDVFSKWGEGLQSGGIRALSRVASLLDASEEKLAEFGDLLKKIGSNVSNWFADRVENAITRVLDIMESPEWKDASIGGKIGMLWNGVVVDPIKEWWEGGGREKTAQTAEKVGKWLGGAITNALLGIFGATDVLNGDKIGSDTGSSIAKSFVSGFLENFDGAAITEAFKTAVSNVWNALPWWGKALVGGYAASAVGGMVQNVAGGAAALMGGGAKAAGTAASVIGSTTGGGLLGLGTKAGFAVGAGSGMTSMGALSAIGLGSIAGGLAGGAGVLSGLWDIFKGTRREGKEAKDEYVKGGTKIGMVGAGAATGAAIGSVIPGLGTLAGGLIGAGVGGLGAIFGGSKIGKWISDATDGWGEQIKTFFTETVPAFFTETIPEAAGKAKEAVVNFFTVTVPEKWNEFWTGVGEFFSETVPYALGYAVAKVGEFFTTTLPEKWNSFWDAVGAFFTETLPAWASDTWNNHIVPFFTVTIPEKWDALWTAIGTFFTETLPTWAGDIWDNKIVPFFTDSVPGFFGQLWDSVTTFFTEGLPTIAETIWGAIKGFFTDTIPGWISSVWDGVKNWWGGVKENFSAGFSAGGGGKARGGVVYPAGMNAPAFAEGGLVGGAGRLVRVAEEGTPEMIIPLGSQRRQRGLGLWARAGQMLGVGTDAGIRYQQYGASAGASGGQPVQVDVGGITIEVNVDGGNGQTVTDAIKAQAQDIAETVAGILADAFNAQFENTPVRGGAY